MNDAIQRTKKQWHAEKEQRLRLIAESLQRGVPPWGEKNQMIKAQITEELMQLLSEKRLKLLDHMEAQYGSDIRQTVALMLAEFTTTATTSLNIVERMTNSSATLNNFPRLRELNYLDRLLLDAHMTNIAWGGHLDFRVYKDAKGRIAIRARTNADNVPESDENG